MSSVWDVYEYVFGTGGTTTTRYYLCSVNDRVGDVPKMIFPCSEANSASWGLSWNTRDRMNESYCTESEPDTIQVHAGNLWSIVTTIKVPRLTPAQATIGIFASSHNDNDDDSLSLSLSLSLSPDTKYV